MAKEKAQKIPPPAVTQYVPAELITTRDDLIGQILKFKITSGPKAEVADELLEKLKKVEKSISDKFDTALKPLNKAATALRNLKKEAVAPMAAPRDHIRLELREYLLKQEEKQEKAQAKYTERVQEAIKNDAPVPVAHALPSGPALSASLVHTREVTIDLDGLVAALEKALKGSELLAIIPYLELDEVQIKRDVLAGTVVLPFVEETKGSHVRQG